MEHPENSGEYKGLVVNAGIEQPSSVNPYLKRKPKKRQLSVAEYVEGIVKGDVTILSRAVTLVESVKPEHQAIAQEVIEKCLPYSGNSVRVGISGVPGAGKTAVNWPVTPECLYWGPKFLYERYKKPIYITENGMACHDVVSLDQRVHDPNRIDFLARYLHELKRAAEEIDLRGYFQWSLMDNFEWEKGYAERFGIVYVDFETQERILKDSAYWYRDVIQTNGRDL